MKVLVGGISHETNTYATALWGTTELQHFTQSAGSEMLDRHRTARAYILGLALRCIEKYTDQSTDLSPRSSRYVCRWNDGSSSRALH